MRKSQTGQPNEQGCERLRRSRCETKEVAAPECAHVTGCTFETLAMETTTGHSAASCGKAWTMCDGNRSCANAGSMFLVVRRHAQRPSSYNPATRTSFPLGLRATSPQTPPHNVDNTCLHMKRTAQMLCTNKSVRKSRACPTRDRKHVGCTLIVKACILHTMRGV